jgi:hypothetical protein
MARYDRIFATLARRALAHASADAQAFVEKMLEAGASHASIGDALADDLLNDGQVFGKFERSLRGAAATAVQTASRQGEMMVAGRRQLERLRRMNAVEGTERTIAGEKVLDRSVLRELGLTLDEAVDDASPGAAEEVEDALLHDVLFTWVCTLVNTCNRCLPLHGKTRPMREWREDALLPELIHEGWDSSCYCRLVDDGFGTRKELLAPLKRIKSEGKAASKWNRRTVRAIEQKDVDAALKERDKALASDEGRRALSRLGRANAGQIETGEK